VSELSNMETEAEGEEEVDRGCGGRGWGDRD